MTDLLQQHEAAPECFSDTLEQDVREVVFGYRAVRQLRRTFLGLMVERPDLQPILVVERFEKDRVSRAPSPKRNSLMGAKIVFCSAELPDATMPEDSSGANYPNIPCTD